MTDWKTNFQILYSQQKANDQIIFNLQNIDINLVSKNTETSYDVHSQEK